MEWILKLYTIWMTQFFETGSEKHHTLKTSSQKKSFNYFDTNHAQFYQNSDIESEDSDNSVDAYSLPINSVYTVI